MTWLRWGTPTARASPRRAGITTRRRRHTGCSGWKGAWGSPSRPGGCRWAQVVFEPGAIRVARVTGSLGGPAAGPVLAATSDEHVVTIALDTSQESEVKAGDAVTVTLPDGSTTPGVVSSVGTVATTSASQGQSPVTTIPIQVMLTDPASAGSLDQAPVTVNITTATARGVLAVPVTALLATPQRVCGGGGRPAERPAVRAGDARDLRRKHGPRSGDRGADPRPAGRGGVVVTAARRRPSRPGRPRPGFWRFRCWNWRTCRRSTRGSRRCGRWTG